MRYQLIVFDWDGTMMDSTAHIAASIQAAACDLGYQPPSTALARHIIGLGLKDALMAALPQLPSDRYAAMAERYRHHFLAGDRHLRLFDGAFELVQTLAAQGHLLAVATGKSRHGLDRALQISGLQGYFHATRCADECRGKPHPQMLEELMAECGTQTTNTLMIGDTSHDLEMAANAGIDALAICHGAHARETLAAARPLCCVDNMAELAHWLRNL